MEHILTECQATGQQTIWEEAEKTWNRMKMKVWYQPNFATILVCGEITISRDSTNTEQRGREKVDVGRTRL
jgi:hypothetical protein